MGTYHHELWVELSFSCCSWIFGSNDQNISFLQHKQINILLNFEILLVCVRNDGCHLWKRNYLLFRSVRVYNGFSGTRVFIVLRRICRSLCVCFVLCFCPLQCLYFFLVRRLITPLVYSNISYTVFWLQTEKIFSQFSGCWLILSVYILISSDFPFGRLLGVW